MNKSRTRKRPETVSVSSIKVAKRMRNEVGNLDQLAESIETHGLLQPIGITLKNQLVFGLRRLKACEKLGMKEIDVRIVDTDAIYDAQIDENIVRKQYTPSELVAIVDSIHGFGHGGDRRSDQAGKSKLELTLKEACERVGWSDGTYRRAKAAVDNCIEEVVIRMDDGDLSIAAADELAKFPEVVQEAFLSKRHDEDKLTARGVKKQVNRVQNAMQREELQKRPVKKNKNSDIKTFHCRFQDLGETAKLEPNSATLICADVPYGADFIDQLDDLGLFCKTYLKEGGTAAIHLGNLRLDEKLQLLTKHLTYQWMAVSYWDSTPTPIQPLEEKRIYNSWIPIALLSKGKWQRDSTFVDLIGPNEAEKDWHDWQRPLPELLRIVETFSSQGELVIDPCCASSTTGAACQALNRRYLGCDLDKAAVVLSQDRLAGKDPPPKD